LVSEVTFCLFSGFSGMYLSSEDSILFALLNMKNNTKYIVVKLKNKLAAVLKKSGKYEETMPGILLIFFSDNNSIPVAASMRCIISLTP
jgi:hypothetical protein